MSKRSELLRQERYAEYQDFLESKKKGQKSIAEIRREMAREREQEIRNTHNITNTSRQAQGQSSTDYDSLRHRKREEERQYRGAMHYDGGSSRPEEEEREHRARRRWNNEAPPHPITTHQRVRFDDRGGGRESEITNRGYSSRGWEEDERELMTWARGGGGGGGGHIGSRNRSGDSGMRYRQERERARARTPPDVESPRKRVDQDDQKSAKMRSISAPSVHGGAAGSSAGGIFALGGRREEDSAETKRNKQREYAEILRAQIKEREEAKERERVKEEMVVMEVRDAEDEKPPSLRNRQTSQKSTRDMREEHHYKERYIL